MTDRQVRDEVHDPLPRRPRNDGLGALRGRCTSLRATPKRPNVSPTRSTVIGDRAPTADDVPQLTYTEAVL